jgi:hypothetical protein
VAVAATATKTTTSGARERASGGREERTRTGARTSQRSDERPLQRSSSSSDVLCSFADFRNDRSLGRGTSGFSPSRLLPLRPLSSLSSPALSDCSLQVPLPPLKHLSRTSTHSQHPPAPSTMPSVIPVAVEAPAVAPPSLKETKAANEAKSAIPTFPPFQYADIFDSDKQYGDFRDDIVKKGYAVIPALSVEKALSLREQAHSWVEGFERGYKRDDPSTFTVEKLPVSVKGGAFSSLFPSSDGPLTSYCGLRHVPWIWYRSRVLGEFFDLLSPPFLHSVSPFPFLSSFFLLPLPFALSLPWPSSRTH